MRFGYEVFHPDPRVPADFYVTALRFARPHAVVEDPDADYLAVIRDGLHVGCTRHPEAQTTNRRPPHGSEIVLRVDDVGAEYEHYLRQSWPVADNLQRRPWGLTDFRVFDPPANTSESPARASHRGQIARGDRLVGR